MTLAQARALVPKLARAEPRQRLRARRPRGAAEVAERFSPRVETAAPGLVFLDADGQRTLPLRFRPRRTTPERELGRALARRGAGAPRSPARVGIAGSKLAAEVAAPERGGRPTMPPRSSRPATRRRFLAPLPLARLAPELRSRRDPRAAGASRRSATSRACRPPRSRAGWDPQARRSTPSRAASTHGRSCRASRRSISPRAASSSGRWRPSSRSSFSPVPPSTASAGGSSTRARLRAPRASRSRLEPAGHDARAMGSAGADPRHEDAPHPRPARARSPSSSARRRRRGGDRRLPLHRHARSHATRRRARSSARRRSRRTGSPRRSRGSSPCSAPTASGRRGRSTATARSASRWCRSRRRRRP